MKNPTAPSPRIALAMACGGSLEANHETGALCALRESLNGIHINDLKHDVAASAVGMSNTITPMPLFALLIEDHKQPTVQTAELQGKPTW